MVNICWITENPKEFQKNIYFCFIDYAKAFDSVDHNKRWKILKEVGIPDQLTCLRRNLYAGQEASVRTGHGTTDWFKTGQVLSSQEFFRSGRKPRHKGVPSRPPLCRIPSWQQCWVESKVYP